MSSFRYECKIGQYSDDVRVDIDLTVKGGVHQDDYQKLKEAFATIEEIAYGYILPEENQQGDIPGED